MKKIIAIALCCTAAVSAKAALFITNNTNCPIAMSIRGRDAAHPGECQLQSIPVVVAASSTVAYNNVTSLNTAPGWENGTIAVVTGSVWDGVKFSSTGGTGTFGGWLGSGCGAVFSVTIPNACGGATLTGNYTVIGSNVFVEFN